MGLPVKPAILVQGESITRMQATMDEQKFQSACQLRDQGKLTEAYDEFIQLAESAADPLDKAGATIYAANTLEISGQIEAATKKLREARSLIEGYPHPKSGADEKLSALELFLDYEGANLLWLRGGDLEAALDKFEAAIKKHRLEARFSKHNLAPIELHARDFYEAIQIRRAFILADLGRWKEALPILEGIESPREYKEGIAFYLGHCYLAAQDYGKAEQKLTKALKLGGLPASLEYRAHCELGMLYYNIGEYSKAKKELQIGAEKADPIYIKESKIWKRLELACRALGLKAEAEHYAHMQNPS